MVSITAVEAAALETRTGTFLITAAKTDRVNRVWLDRGSRCAQAQWRL